MNYWSTQRKTREEIIVKINFSTLQKAVAGVSEVLERRLCIRSEDVTT